MFALASLSTHKQTHFYTAAGHHRVDGAKKCRQFFILTARRANVKTLTSISCGSNCEKEARLIFTSNFSPVLRIFANRAASPLQLITITLFNN